MSLTVKGLSTTVEPDTFAYETFTARRGTFVQWDYRDPAGNLFSGVASTLDAARAKAQQHGYQMQDAPSIIPPQPDHH